MKNDFIIEFPFDNTGVYFLLKAQQQLLFSLELNFSFIYLMKNNINKLESKQLRN